MYIVVDKNTGAVVHTNPAPTYQGLKGREVYFHFDPETMEIGETDDPLPAHFKVASGRVFELSVEEQIERGIRSLEPHQVVRGGKVVEMSLKEKVKAGLVRLEPSEKITMEGGEARIVRKSLRELVEGGALELPPTKRISDDGEGIVDKSPRELVDDRVIDLTQLKERRMKELTAQALEARRRVVPDHELSYAALGLRSKGEVERYREVVRQSERSLAQAQKRLDDADSVDEILAIEFESPEP